MFEDVSQYKDFDKVAVIMTGMGHDGSNGLKALKILAMSLLLQNQLKLALYMVCQKRRVETQLVDEVADVDDIAQTIMKYLP